MKTYKNRAEAAHEANKQGKTLKEVKGGWQLMDVEISLDELKLAKKSEIIKAKEEAEFAPFAFGEITIDADEKSQSNIGAKVLLISVAKLPSVEWVTYNNQIITMNSNDFVAMSIALASRTQTIVFKGRALKDKIDVAASKEEIEAISWESENV